MYLAPWFDLSHTLRPAQSPSRSFSSWGKFELMSSWPWNGRPCAVRKIKFWITRSIAACAWPCIFWRWILSRHATELVAPFINCFSMSCWLFVNIKALRCILPIAESSLRRRCFRWLVQHFQTRLVKHAAWVANDSIFFFDVWNPFPLAIPRTLESMFAHCLLPYDLTGNVRCVGWCGSWVTAFNFSTKTGVLSDVFRALLSVYTNADGSSAKCAPSISTWVLLVVLVSECWTWSSSPATFRSFSSKCDLRVNVSIADCRTRFNGRLEDPPAI